MRTVPTSPKVRLAALGLFCALGLSFSAPALADEHLREDGSAIIYTEIVYPTSGQDSQSFTSLDRRAEYFAEGKVEDLAQYISIIYNFLISIVGLVASVAMIVGGFQYLTSAGDASKIGAAKTRMTNAFMGMVLALGAFTILRTVNPALLTMKSLNVKNIGTEIAFLPWCEDIMKIGKTVTPLKGTECGGLGEFDSGPNQKLHCAYYGSCRLTKAGMGKSLGAPGQVATCMQIPGLTTEDIKKRLEADPNTPFAYCTACGFITEARASALGYSGLPAACSKWMGQVNGFRKVDSDNQNLWTFCTAAMSYKSCIQVNLDCEAINTNSDDGDSSCDSSKHQCGCEGYDESPEPYWSNGNKGGFEQPTVFESFGSETLEDHESLLSRVCRANPCKDYVDPHVTEPEKIVPLQIFGKTLNIRVGPRSFIDGCGGSGSFVGDIAAFAEGEENFPDCRKLPPSDQ